MNGVAIFFIILLVLLVVAAVGWVVFTQLRARRLGVSSSPQPKALDRQKALQPTCSTIQPFAHPLIYDDASVA
jgi:hypothetical protein